MGDSPVGNVVPLVAVGAAVAAGASVAVADTAVVVASTVAFYTQDHLVLFQRHFVYVLHTWDLPWIGSGSYRELMKILDMVELYQHISSRMGLYPVD